MRKSRAFAQAGFTLVELMVVLVIIGLAAGAVVLAIPEAGGSVQEEAERFAARAKAARDTAIIEARPARLEVSGVGYEVQRRSGGEWQSVSQYEWVDGTVADAGTTRFDTTGLAQPLFVTLRRGERAASVEIRTDGTVHVQR